MSTVFIVDGFTEAVDTSLTAHAPETGGAWSAYGSPYIATATVLASEGRITGSSSSSSALYTNAALPPSADVLVQATVRFTSSTGKRAGLVARYSASGTENGYLVFYDGSAWLLRKMVAGVGTDLGSYSASIALNTDVLLQLEAFGSILTVSIDGVPRIVATDTTFTAAGRGGLLLRSGGHIDHFSARTLDAQPARWSQGAVEVVSQPDPQARLTQSLAEVLIQPRAPSRLTQLAVEALVLPFAPGRLAQAAVEVLWRDARLAGDLAPRLAGAARLDQGTALAGEVQLTVSGAAALEIGTELSEAQGQIDANWAADLRATHRLSGTVATQLAGVADLLLGDEIRGTGRLALIANGRLAGQAPASSGFWLLF